MFPARTIVTMDPAQPAVEAVAVRDGRILAAGSFDECASWGPHVVDRRFADHVLVPGMIEAHAHTLEGAFSMIPYVGWFDRHRADGGTAPGIRTYDALLDRLRELDAETQGSDEPIVVGGFDPIYFTDEERLTRDHLDRVSTERPIFVFHASAHLATVNTAMLERHEIDPRLDDARRGPRRRRRTERRAAGDAGDRARAIGGERDPAVAERPAGDRGARARSAPTWASRCCATSRRRA